MSSSALQIKPLERTKVSFVCQRCRQPLKIDKSFDTIDLESDPGKEFTAPLLDSDDREQHVMPELADQYTEDYCISRLTIPDRYASLDDDTSGFTLLGETGPSSLGNLGHKSRVKAALFDIMSGQSSVDHPLCEECTDSLLNQLDIQLKITEEECKDYRNFLEELQNTGDSEDDAELDRELEQLQSEEKSLLQQLEQTALEQELVQANIKREKEVTKQFEEEELRHWKEYNEYKRQVLELDDAQRSVDNQLKYAQAQLDKLKITNVFNATFHIWHSGHFGIINHFRLGRLPSVPVEWNEINAAWGQTVLLLHSLARKMNLTFQRYRLMPYGNQSYIESLSDKTKELPLYASGGLKFFWDTKFDQAMVAFLDCLQQFKEEVEKGNSEFSLPYKMDKGKIEDSATGSSYSIKVQFNSEEQWTKALKFMLINLKWGLTWGSV